MVPISTLDDVFEINVQLADTKVDAKLTVL